MAEVKTGKAGQKDDNKKDTTPKAKSMGKKPSIKGGIARKNTVVRRGKDPLKRKKTGSTFRTMPELKTNGKDDNDVEKKQVDGEIVKSSGNDESLNDQDTEQSQSQMTSDDVDVHGSEVKDIRENISEVEVKKNQPLEPKPKKEKTEAQKARERARRKRRRLKKREEKFQPGEDVPLIITSDDADAAELSNSVGNEEVQALGANASEETEPMNVEEKPVDESEEIQEEVNAEPSVREDETAISADEDFVPDVATDEGIVPDQELVQTESGVQSVDEEVGPEKDMVQGADNVQDADELFVETQKLEPDLEPSQADLSQEPYLSQPTYMGTGQVDEEDGSNKNYLESGVDGSDDLSDYDDLYGKSIFGDEPSNDGNGQVEELQNDSKKDEFNTNSSENAAFNQKINAEAEEVRMEAVTEEENEQNEENPDDFLDEQFSGDGLEEMPANQGIMGKMFDMLVGLIHGESDIDKIKAKEPLEVSSIDFSDRFWAILKKLLIIIIVVASIIGAYLFGASLRLFDWLNVFNTNQSNLELWQSEDQELAIDVQMLAKYGFSTADIFGRNLGNTNDLLFNSFFIANYFGKLKDPVFYGETGVTAALFYGFNLDDEYNRSRFIYYNNYLKRLENANDVSITTLLEGKVRRDLIIENYLKETRSLLDTGAELDQEISLQIDELRIAFNSYNDEKTRFETDFFVAADSMQGEKSQILLEKFIEVSQKQTELKAKIAALSKLHDLYQQKLLVMKLRVEAIEKNKEALASGVKVTEVPGVELNLIKR